MCIAYRLLLLTGAALCLLVTSAQAGPGAYTEHTLPVGDVQRAYKVYVPKSLPAGEKARAVVAFHGFESDPNGFRWLIKPDSSAERTKTIVVYPTAIKKSWNAGKGSGSRNKDTDDLAFAGALLEALPKAHPIDPRRIAVVGFSNGAQMAAMIACHHAQRVSAVVMVSHTLNIEGCTPSQPTSIAIINGVKDPFVPFQGGGRHGLRSHKDSVAFFKQLNGSGIEKKIVDLKTVRCTQHRATEAGPETVSCVAFDSGHTWPKGVDLNAKVFGPVNQELDATKFVFNFVVRNDPGKEAATAPLALSKPSTRPASAPPAAQPVTKASSASRPSSSSKSKDTIARATGSGDGKGASETPQDSLVLPTRGRSDTKRMVPDWRSLYDETTEGPMNTEPPEDMPFEQADGAGEGEAAPVFFPIGRGGEIDGLGPSPPASAIDD